MHIIKISKQILLIATVFMYIWLHFDFPFEYYMISKLFYNLSSSTS
jgi:hypothetical protein